MQPFWKNVEDMSSPLWLKVLKMAHKGHYVFFAVSDVKTPKYNQGKR